MSFRKFFAVVVVVFVASTSAATATVLVSRANSTPSPVATAGTKYGSWAPGVSAPITALNSLARPANVPAVVTTAISRAAIATGGDVGLATSTVRRLRATSEVQGAGIYAYTPGEKAACVVYWPRFGTCPTARESDHPGVIFGFSPGGPGHPGQIGDLQPAIAGVVADNVQSVTLVSNGTVTTLDIVNNSFLGMVERPKASSDWRIVVKFRYRGGTERVVNIPDPRADRSS